MSEIRVSHIHRDVTEKQLKMYFSNPRNGGGRVQNILYPLMHNSAIITYDDQSVAENVLSRSHQLKDKTLEVEAVPRQIFSHVVVEVVRDVSDFMVANSQIVDELQFLGEVDVHFQKSKNAYFLSGSWYQTEWALHYLNTSLESSDFDPASSAPVAQPTGYEHSSLSTGQRSANSGGHVTGDNQNFHSPEQREAVNVGHVAPVARDLRSYQVPQKQVQRSNFPEVTQLDRQPQRQPQQQGDTQYGYQQLADTKIEGQSVSDEKKIRKKNKNLMPGLASGSVTESTTARGQDRPTGDMYGNSRAIGEGHREQNMPATDHTSHTSNAYGGSSSEKGDIAGAQARSFNPNDYGGYYSDSDDDTWSPQDRRVDFAPDTNFMEGKSRPRRHHGREFPEVTRGIDVSETNFGEAPLTFTFELAKSVQVCVAMSDVTNQFTDAIVNPTSSRLMGMSAVSRAILAMAGHEMQLECGQIIEEKGELNFGQVVHTSAGGKLNQKVGFIMHAYGPHWRESDSELCTHMLICTYLNCFMYADKLWLQSIATPLINTGPYGFPLDVSIQAFFDALLLFSTNAGPKLHLKNINLCCFDEDTSMAAIMITRSLLDCETSQAAVAATDRYLMRKTNMAFEAEYFKLRPDPTEAHPNRNTDATDDQMMAKKTEEYAPIAEQGENEDTAVSKGDVGGELTRAVKAEQGGMPKAEEGGMPQAEEGNLEVEEPTGDTGEMRMEADYKQRAKTSMTLEEQEQSLTPDTSVEDGLGKTIDEKLSVQADVANEINDTADTVNDQKGNDESAEMLSMQKAPETVMKEDSIRVDSIGEYSASATELETPDNKGPGTMDTESSSRERGTGANVLCKTQLEDVAIEVCTSEDVADKEVGGAANDDEERTESLADRAQSNNDPDNGIGKDWSMIPDLAASQSQRADIDN